MKWLRRIFLALILLFALATISFLLYFPRTAPPPSPPPATAADVARGRYLFESVLTCHDCHSRRDFRFYAGPVVGGSEGGGAWVVDRVIPTHSANITPFALSEWTDGEIMRAIAAGVNREGKALHPLMPFDTYASLAQSDLRAVVAYLRTLPRVEREVPQWKARSAKDFLIVKVIGRALPQPYEPKDAPPRSDRVAYGRYLARIADCMLCHGPELKGGRAIPIGDTGATAVARDLTKSARTKEEFIALFRSFQSVAAQPVPAGSRNTPMPWLRFAFMSDDDLEALYEYAQSLP